jgi:hypothetical protein
MSIRKYRNYFINLYLKMKSIDKNTVDRTDPFTALGINNSSLQSISYNNKDKNSVSQRTTSNFSLNQ